MATIAVNLPLNVGVSGTYLLYLYNGSTLLNTGGDTLTEVGNGYFTATVAETVSATVAYRADVTRNGTLLYSGWLQSGVSSVVDDPGANVKAVLGVAVTPTSLPVDANVVDIDSDVLDEIEDAIDCSGLGQDGPIRVVVPVSSIPTQIVRRVDSKLLMRRWARFGHVIENVGDLAGVEKIVFTVKSNSDVDTDAESMIQVVLSIPGDAGDGITYINGEEADSEEVELGSISAEDYTDNDEDKKRIVIEIMSAATGLVPVKNKARWDVKLVYENTSDVIDDGEIEVISSVGRI